MATVNLTTTPATLNDGTAYTVQVTNTGPGVVELSRGGRLRPQQSATVYPEGTALTATAVSGTGSVTTATTTRPVTPTSLRVQATNPGLTTPGVWVQTDGAGGVVTIWVETGGA